MTDEYEIEMLFKACCVLHNMILVYDHRDLEHWETDVQWEYLDPGPEDIDYTDVEDNWDEYSIPEVREDTIEQLPVLKISRVEPLKLKPKGNNTPFTELLCVSFSFQFQMDLLSWPRNFSQHQKQILSKNRLASITSRIEIDLYETLVVAPSILRIKDAQGKFTEKIDNGLFAGIRYKPRDRIVDWMEGERISKSEYEKRVEEGKGGYALKINAGEVMDFYSVRHRCKASMSNSHIDAYNTVTRRPARPNATMHAFRKHDRCTFFLRATNYIEPMEEIIWDYNKDYIFPSVKSRR
jgi:hypothetical protein